MSSVQSWRRFINPINTMRQVEDELKRRFMHLEFGKYRLFLRPAVAAWRGPPDGIKHKVGMCYSDKIPEFVENGDIIVRELNTSNKVKYIT